MISYFIMIVMFVINLLSTYLQSCGFFYYKIVIKFVRIKYTKIKIGPINS